MQNFKTFYKIVWQKKTYMIIYLSVFMALSILFTTIEVSDSEKNFAKEQYKIAVFDKDGTTASKAFVKYLSSIHKLVEIEDDVDVCKDKLFSRTVECVIYITEGYEQAIIKGSFDGVLEYMSIPDSVYASTITGQADQYIRLLCVQLAGGNAMEEALLQVESVMQKEINIQFLGQDTTTGYSKIYYAFLFQPYALISISISVIGMTLLVFRNQKLANRIRCSSLRFTRQHSDILLAAMGTEMGFVLLFVIAAFFIGGNYFTSYRAIFYILNVLLFAAFCLSITFCIGMIGARAEVLNMIGTVCGLALSFLGGIFVPMEFFGDTLRNVVRLIPSYWYVHVLRMLEQSDISNKLSEIMLSLGIQAGFTVAFIAIALVIGKIKRQ